MRRRRTAIDVYTAIKDMILTGKLRQGSRLSDQELALELGVSRTPVRHALGNLEQEGFLSNVRGRGYQIHDPDAKEVADLYALREVLEAHAVRLAVERVGPVDLAEFAEVLATIEQLQADPAKRGEEIRVGLRVHEILARASGDAFLHDTMVRLLNRMHFFIWMETINEDSRAAAATRQQHNTLLECLRTKQPDHAEELVRQHIREAKQGILRILAARDAFYQPMQDVRTAAPAGV